MITPDITLYGISNCDTVKKARAWLSAQGLEYQFHDFKKHGVPADRLTQWMAAVGWEKLVNRQGTTWRKLDTATQAAVCDAASANALLQAHASAIKRPVVEWRRSAETRTTVGFDAALWTQLLHGAG
ncbi:ArsC family reductase [Simplicispira psychrophila]|uniref:ArsC family reductase n=1 Tax=Simplicispira psychrophila TaxID=80882 RepID=UPI00056B2C14|nr:ArsC family reductase [Simplicispira psychrophila]